MKICLDCKCEKSLDQFCKLSARKDQLHYYCRDCSKNRSRVWRINNLEKITKLREKYKTPEMRDKINAREREKYKNDSDYRNKTLESVKQSQKRRRDKINRYQRNRWKTNPNYKLRSSLKNRLYEAMTHSGIAKDKSILKYLGCQPEFLKQYIESKWLPGMSWDNYNIDGWHIDHIIPCKAFNFLVEKDRHECFHYSNLQPMWGRDNIIKSCKLEDGTDVRDFMLEKASELADDVM